jgi:hypothetical protein
VEIVVINVSVVVMETDIGIHYMDSEDVNDTVMETMNVNLDVQKGQLEME